MSLEGDVALVQESQLEVRAMHFFPELQREQQPKHRTPLPANLTGAACDRLASWGDKNPDPFFTFPQRTTKMVSAGSGTVCSL